MEHLFIVSTIFMSLQAPLQIEPEAGKLIHSGVLLYNKLLAIEDAYIVAEYINTISQSHVLWDISKNEPINLPSSRDSDAMQVFINKEAFYLSLFSGNPQNPGDTGEPFHNVNISMNKRLLNNPEKMVSWSAELPAPEPVAGKRRSAFLGKWDEWKIDAVSPHGEDSWLVLGRAQQARSHIGGYLSGDFPRRSFLFAARIREGRLIDNSISGKIHRK